MSVRVAAADLGKSSAKLLTGRIEAGRVVLEASARVEHDGSPLEALTAFWVEHQVGNARAFGVTGLYADELVAPALSGLPEDACLEAALGLLPELAGPLNFVSVGARGYAVMVRDPAGRVQYLENDKCSSGTGETMVKTAARFGMTLEEADRLAAEVREPIAITARCSVFAKSEMTHFGNQGEPADRLFRGYFDSIARYVAALLGRARVEGPVYLVGGGSRLLTLRQCLAEQLGSEVRLVEQGLWLEGLGALSLAAEHATNGHARPLPRDPRGLYRDKSRKIRALPPARSSSARVTRLAARAVATGAASEPSVLGLDLGSTGSKAALVSLATGEVVLDLYDRTRGNPVEAAQRLVRELYARVEPDVRAVGVTGSGREAVATVLRAALGDAAERVVVQNEIVAHATAAIRCDAHAGKSLSVVEIGGQDAKFIQIADGQIVESDMNKACSAGTGSFLEEQSVFYGVHEIEEFTRQAALAEAPPELGQMCTVFVAEAAAEARAEGYSIPDLFAGFQYSVIHNYLNRVMGQRAFGERIFFQGKPASGESLAWTLAAVSGREVIVPANPGAMGAWGIGLCAKAELGESLAAAQPLELGALSGARVVSKTDFRCDDKRCATLCRIERATVAVAGAEKTVFSGGSCPKFEVARASRPKLPVDAPSAFDEREALLEPYFAGAPGKVMVDVPCVGSLAGWLPWTVTLLRELGLGVRVLRSDGASLARGEELCHAYDSCAPMKIAHGVGAESGGLSFFPRLLDLVDRDGAPGRTCSTEQGMPVVLAQVLQARGQATRVVAPVVSFEHGLTAPGVMFALIAAVRELGADPLRLPAAIHRAAEAQRDFQRALAAIGRRTLGYGRARSIPMVVVTGSEHVLFDRSVNAGIPGILRQNGVLALPMDCYPVPGHVDPVLSVAWADARRAVRVALAAREAGDVYPLWLSSFGCGPSSFVEQLFGYLMHGYPHTCLESDGHGGAAGFVTRIQSFLHGVRQYGRRPAPVPQRRLDVIQPLERRPLAADEGKRLVVLSIGGRLSEIAAASYRAFGHHAVASGPNTPDTLAAGRKDCSGKECLPYQLIWGSFRRELTERPPNGGSVLVQVTGQGACRNCMFTIKDKISVELLGLSAAVDFRHFGAEDDVRGAFQTRFWAGVLGFDVLKQLWAYHLALDPGGQAVGELERRHGDELVHLLERPVGSLITRRRHWAALLDLLERAARDYARLEPRRTPENRTVLLTGDVYLRVDDFANDGLVAALAARGLRSLIEPMSVMVEYLTHENSDELIGLSRGFFEHLLSESLGLKMRREAYARVLPLHPWLARAEIPEMLERARPIIDGTPFGEAPITVGSVLAGWHDQRCDGVALVAPWGCGPSLLSESLLRHQHEIPMLFLYSDGSPLDGRRLNAFAHRLRRRPARTLEATP